jgi:prepilin-type N-terminal cleavage/methylation domain-containing protein
MSAAATASKRSTSHSLILSCYLPLLWYNHTVFSHGIRRPAFASLRRGAQRCRGGCVSRIVRSPQRESDRAFTLVELLVVIAIIAILMVLVAPAFTSIKSGTDVTSAAYTVKGVLDTARTYAKANNTYTWVGFWGSIGSPVTGEVTMVIIASKDGTNGALVGGDVTQVGKMEKLDNVHIGNAGVPSGNGTDFGGRPNVDTQHSIFSAPTYSFAIQGTLFTKWIQFSPRGEAGVIGESGGSTDIAPYTEIGLRQTHGTVMSTNLAAIQIGGMGGNVAIYRP